MSSGGARCGMWTRMRWPSCWWDHCKHSRCCRMCWASAADRRAPALTRWSRCCGAGWRRAGCWRLKAVLEAADAPTRGATRAIPIELGDGKITMEHPHDEDNAANPLRALAIRLRRIARRIAYGLPVRWGEPGTGALAPASAQGPLAAAFGRYG